METFKKSIFYFLSALSMTFLLISPIPIFIHSSFIFYSISGVAILILIAFFVQYRKVLSKNIEKQIVYISEIKPKGFLESTKKCFVSFIRIFTIFSPYTIGLLALTN